MSDDQWTWTRAASIASVHSAAVVAAEEIIAKLGELGWPEAEIFGVRLALEEAFANAIKHGNAGEHHKQIHVDCRIAPHRIWICVMDEGEGFDPDDVPDCTADEYIDRPSGRGIMLMRSFMTYVEYSAAGNCVVMEKHRSAGALGGPS